METIAPDSALASFVNHLSTLDLEVYIFFTNFSLALSVYYHHVNP
jgi:hypothetical protein